jgi:adenosylcobinamide-phosphate synthase
MIEPVALGALALDAMIGWPDRIYRMIGHPVGGFARIITACAARWNGADRSRAGQRIAGIATVALLLAVSGGIGWMIEFGLRQLLGAWSWPLIALAAFPALAQRSLRDHVVPVARALAAGDLARARTAVGMIVGRDTAELDERGVARAAIESLAESFCDGVVAPLFWLLALGLPGMWAYKALNTADSMIGHIEEPWRDFGWAAARLDDVANLLPARLAGVLLCLGGSGGWRVMWRDCRRHASPNAGWPEAAMAGALEVRLAGPATYDGELSDKAWIGDGGSADAPAIGRALAIYGRACAMLWLIAAGWALVWETTWLG